ncbi:CoaE-domain-containing protein [Suhomyces tanzawaensis NRRL Y-17324]|uniref:CoaE-domain-containing protein n=1 Tax=Suhomyces tanzawaensis NRRL Y-17324 TaxID=984487 RepID=A0A1E4SMD7_9ASCO|nr:CoaE-domain-containing protein [Suhomyces tanzawaensis NRRL Y-17324]ODV80542.1 CoaE-domain-containing protein [Suhomyces tanzawaensis NRRL Y-17324]
MLIVGLTGGIATGKSTVSKTLHERHNYTIVDADLIAKEVVYPGKRAYEEVVKAFKDEVEDLVNPNDFSLNRGALGAAVFGNRERLNKLNSIVHPAVKKEIVWQIFHAYVTAQSLVILDVPLLFESGLDKICGLTVTVTCADDIQKQRLQLRNPELSAEDVQKRIDSQMSNAVRNHRADLVIDNSKDLKRLKQSIDEVAKEIHPGIIFTALDLFPPFGLISALFTFAIRSVRDRLKGNEPKKND